MKTTTLKKGEILYHSSYTKDTFDPVKINLNKGKKYLSAYFSTNKKIASARIKDCTAYPQKQGYIHTFEIKNDIDNIYLLSQYDLSEWNLKLIEEKYCNSSNDDGDKYNGFLDGVLKYSTPSDTIPGGLWFGHPYYSDLPGWSDFKLDYIRITLL